jgi:hypothetical protein
MPAMKKHARYPIRVGPFTHIREEPEGWSVGVVRHHHRIQDYFGNAVYGGRSKALIAARRFRDRLLLRVDPDTRAQRRPPKGHRTGVPGVTLERYMVEGRAYQRYVASWVDPEKGRQRRRLSVLRHGKERARALAMEAREKGAAHARGVLLARQREEARKRLAKSPPQPRRVKHPLSRKGIRMPPRRPRARR